MKKQRHPCTQWTEEADEQMLMLWHDGLSAQRVGDAIGKSRSAVLGRLHRLGEQRRADTPRRRCSARGLAKRSVRARKKMERLTPDRKPRMTRDERIHLANDLPLIAGRPLDELDTNQCRYGVTDPDMPSGHLFCGAPTHHGPWCPHHRAVVFRPRHQQQKGALLIVHP